jgi:hypothetical protein
VCEPALAQGASRFSLLSERYGEGAASQGSNLAARRLASSESATGMASAAVTSGSAAAALVPFEMSLECLPAKNDSRNFLIEWS